MNKTSEFQVAWGDTPHERKLPEGLWCKASDYWWRGKMARGVSRLSLACWWFNSFINWCVSSAVAGNKYESVYSFTADLVSIRNHVKMLCVLLQDWGWTRRACCSCMKPDTCKHRLTVSKESGGGKKKKKSKLANSSWSSDAVLGPPILGTVRRFNSGLISEMLVNSYVKYGCHAKHPKSNEVIHLVF